MIRKVLFTLFMLVAIILLSSCSSSQTHPISGPNLPNPASVYCEQNGGKLDLRQDASGGVAGSCIFPDGSECDEWAYFRGECKPGETLVTSVPAPSPVISEPSQTAAVELANDGWKVYRNEQFGYSFHYPADAAIVISADPLKSLSIVGPLESNENWPQITISHPRDRAEYRPPEGVDLEKWLTDYYLLSTDSQQPSSEVRQPDVHIAGIVSIHTRFDRSPQSFAYDRYYFARSGQLYMIVIGHVGDKEDWDLYNHFLESIQFGS